MLGRDLTALLTARNEEFTGLTRADLDLTNADEVTSAVSSVKPDVVVNCAGWTGVDAAEEHEAEALAVNGQGAGNLAAACAGVGALLVHPSTDYVFDGRTSAPYPEDAPTAPASAYGRSKVAGEQAVRDALPDASYIVRTAWLYSAHGKNFVKTMLRLAGNGTAPGVVADQHGQPTWAADVATQIDRPDRQIRPARHLPRDEFRPNHLVRLRGGNLQPLPSSKQKRVSRTSPAYSPPDHYCRLPDPSGTSRLQRPRP